MERIRTAETKAARHPERLEEPPAPEDVVVVLEAEDDPMDEVEATMPPELEVALAAVEHIIRGIAENARWGLRGDIAELEQRRDELRAEIDALVSERARIAPITDEVRRLLQHSVRVTDDVPETVRASLRPVTSALAAVVERLSEETADAPPDEIRTA